MVKQKRDHRADGPKTALPHFVIKRISEGSFILVLATALLVLISLLTYHTNDPGWSHVTRSSTNIGNAGGQVGAYVADALYFTFGNLAYLLPFCFAYGAWMMLRDHWALRVVNKPMLLLRGTGFLFMICGGCGILSFLGVPAASQTIKHSLGGVVGMVLRVI